MAIWTVVTILIRAVAYSAFTDALVFALIGWRLHRMSRAAAVIGLLVFVAERVFLVG